MLQNLNYFEHHVRPQQVSDSGAFWISDFKIRVVMTLNSSLPIGLHFAVVHASRRFLSTLYTWQKQYKMVNYYHTSLANCTFRDVPFQFEISHGGRNETTDIGEQYQSRLFPWRELIFKNCLYATPMGYWKMLLRRALVKQEQLCIQESERENRPFRSPMRAA